MTTSRPRDVAGNRWSRPFDLVVCIFVFVVFVAEEDSKTMYTEKTV